MPSPTFHLLYEHQDSDPIELSREIAEILTDHPTAQIRVRPSGGKWILRPSQMVGSLQVEDHRFLIRPKIGMSNLLSLLGVDVKSLRFKQDLFDYQQEPDLLVAVVRLFRAALDDTIGQGLRSDYVAISDRIMSIRGRLDLKSITRQPGLHLPIPCHFDEYTVDLNLNRVLKSAILRSLQLPGVSRADKIQLRRHLQLFEDVQGNLFDLKQFEDWVPTRLEEPYLGAVTTASLILKNSSMSDSFGTTTSTSFIVDMNKLVERFVEKRLQAALAGKLNVLGQRKIPFDTGGKFAIKPDLIFEQLGKIVLVGDIKYKKYWDSTGKTGVTTSDLFQIHSYAERLGLRDGILIGCLQGDEGLTSNEAIETIKTKVRIHPMVLDLRGSLHEIEDDLQRLAAEILEIVELNSEHSLRLVM